jgi:hypothetical protein
MAGAGALTDDTLADHEPSGHEFSDHEPSDHEPSGHEISDHEFGAVIGAGTSVRGGHHPSHCLDRPDGPGSVARLAEIRAAGLVRQASERVDRGVERSLPVAAVLRPLLPGGVLRRGGTIALAPGTTSVLFTLLAEATAAGSGCAAVGLPQLGMVAAAEAGVAVQRCALVPHPGPEWVGAVAALLDGVDIVVVAPPGPVGAQVAIRLEARARQRGAVLIAVGRWPGADLTLEVVISTWHGLGQGRGRLRRHDLEVVAYGRGAATRVKRLRFALPGGDTQLAVDTRLTPVVATSFATTEVA